MLILTRRVGETIYIGDTTCLTVYDKLCYHVMIGVLAPPNMQLCLAGTVVRPVVLPEGERFYLLNLQSQDAFTIGEARVHVRFNTSFDGFCELLKRQVKIGIEAPRSVEVNREEIHVRKLVESGRRPPAQTFSEWLHRVNLSVSCRVAA